MILQFFCFRRRLGIDFARSEAAWEPPGRLFWLPNESLGSPWAPLRRSRGAPETLRDALGTPLERPGCPKVDFWSIWGTPGTSQDQFLVNLGIDFGLIFQCFGERIASDFGPTFATGSDTSSGSSSRRRRVSKTGPTGRLQRVSRTPPRFHFVTIFDRFLRTSLR